MGHKETQLSDWTATKHTKEKKISFANWVFLQMYNFKQATFHNQLYLSCCISPFVETRVGKTWVGKLEEHARSYSTMDIYYEHQQGRPTLLSNGWYRGNDDCEAQCSSTCLTYKNFSAGACLGHCTCSFTNALSCSTTMCLQLVGREHLTTAILANLLFPYSMYIPWSLYSYQQPPFTYSSCLPYRHRDSQI